MNGSLHGRVKKIRNTFFVFVLLAFPILAFSPGFSHQGNFTHQQTVECGPLDIVFLVDQSDGMKTHDPQGKSIGLVKDLLVLLGADSAFHCEGAPHRAAVITFGGSELEISIDLGLTPLVPSGSFEDWYRTVSAWEQDFDHSEDFWEGRDFLPAFRAAQRQFESASQRDAKQVIVTISDYFGAPDLQEQGVGQNTLPVEGKALLRDLRDTLENEVFAIDEQRGPFLITVAYEGPRNAIGWESYRDHIGDEWTDIVERFGGKYFAVPGANFSDMGTHIVSELLSYSYGADDRFLTKTCDPFFVSALTEHLAILVVKDRPSTQVVIENVETGEALEKQVVSENQEETNASTTEIYYANSVQPGEWRLSGECGDFRYYETASLYSPELQVDPANGSEVPLCLPDLYQCENSRMYVRLLDDNGQEIKIYEGYIPIIEGNIENQPISFTYGDGVFSSNDAIPRDVAIEYSWSLRVSVEPPPDIDTQSRITLTDTAGMFSVGEINPLEIAIVKPTEGERSQLYSSIVSGLIPQPVVVQVQFVDTNGQLASLPGSNLPATITEIFDGPPTEAVKAYLTHVDSGDEVSGFMQVEPTDPFSLVMAFPATLLSEGDYILEVVYEGNEADLSEDFRLVSKAEGWEASFVRECAPLNCPTTITAIQIGLFALTLFVIGSVIYGRTNPVTGDLAFYLDGEKAEIPVANVSLDRKPRRRQKVKRSDIVEFYPTLGGHFKEMDISKIDDDAIRLKVKSLDGEEYPGELISGDEGMKLIHGIKVKYDSRGQGYENVSDEFANDHGGLTTDEYDSLNASEGELPLDEDE